jgi:uncharacterized protein (DUF2336 family)
MTTLANVLPQLDVALERGSAKSRAKLLFSVLDIFVQGVERFSDEEIALFDDIIMRIAAEIETAVREQLAHSLASIAKAPLNVIHMLACDEEIRVARPILSESTRVDEAILTHVAKSQSQAHLLAISQRKSISEAITDILTERGNREVLLGASRNLNAKFSPIGLSRLVKRSAGDDALATTVGLRSDLPRALLITLIATASDVVRQRLANDGQHGRHEIREVIALVTGNARSPQNTGAGKRTTSTANDLETLQRFVQAGNFDKALEALANICDAPLNVVKQAISRDRTETIMILGKAAGMSWASIRPLLMFSQSLHDPAAIAVERLRSGFDRLAPYTAKRIVEFYKLRDTSPASRS